VDCLKEGLKTKILVLYKTACGEERKRRVKGQTVGIYRFPVTLQTGLRRNTMGVQSPSDPPSPVPALALGLSPRRRHARSTLAVPGQLGIAKNDRANQRPTW
jgi:hypothetical protein